MVRLSSTYDKEIGKKVFLVRGDESYASIHHFKFICENGSIKWYIDGELHTNSTTSATGMGFTIKNCAIRFRELAVYRI